MVTQSSTVTSPVRTPRANPIESAIKVAERALTRVRRRKDRASARIAKIDARRAKVVASLADFDTVIAQLSKNVESLKSLK